MPISHSGIAQDWKSWPFGAPRFNSWCGRMDKENLELAEEHIKLAEEIIEKEALDAEGKKQEELKKSIFNLEKAEAELVEGKE